MFYSGILGSGFGLYGHMPARLLNSTGSVLLPERYKKKFETRSELKQFETRIKWCGDEEEVIGLSNLLVIAQMPETQEAWIEKLSLEKNNIVFLLLEKPLAATPERSALLLDKLNHSGMLFRIMYSFLYMDWFKTFRIAFTHHAACTAEITWKFRAHHFSNGIDTWKRFHSKGGGVIRFYGIHLLAVAAAIDANTVTSSEIQKHHEDEPYAWQATFENETGNRLLISVDSDSDETEFSVQLHDKDGKIMSIREKDPFFEYTRQDGLDSRIALNEEIMTNLLINDSKQYLSKIYKDTNTLWAHTEALTA